MKLRPYLEGFCSTNPLRKLSQSKFIIRFLRFFLIPCSFASLSFPMKSLFALFRSSPAQAAILLFDQLKTAEISQQKLDLIAQIRSLVLQVPIVSVWDFFRAVDLFLPFFLVFRSVFFVTS